MMLPKIFHKDFDDIHHAAFWLAAFSVLSAFLGMFRDRLLASNFGASRELDIYYSAFRMPDFIYTIFLLFTASTAIIPILIARTNRKDTAAELISSLLILFSIAVILFSTIAFFAMPWFSRFFLPGFLPAEVAKSVFLARILLLSPILLGLSNIFSSIAQSSKRFFVYGLSPVFYNIGIIMGILFLSPRIGLEGIVLGVVFGAFLHMSIQMLSLRDLKLNVVRFSLLNRDIKNIIKLSLPRTVGLQITQISQIIFTGLASLFSAGSIAVFNLSLNLESIPITIIGLSYGVAAFPALAKHSLDKAKENFEKHFSVAFRHIIFWTVPFSALLLVLRAQIVRVVLGAGQFDWADTRLTAASLVLLSFAVVFQSLFMLLVRAFYAEEESWRPLIINAVSAIFGIGAAIWIAQRLVYGHFWHTFFSWALRLGDISDIRVVSLALGMLIGSIINFLFLFFAFKAVFGWFPTRGAWRSICEIFVSSTVGGISTYFFLNIFARFFDLQTFFGIFLQGFLSGVLGVLVIALVLWILGNKEMMEIRFSTLSIFRDRKAMEEGTRLVAAPEPEKLP